MKSACREAIVRPARTSRSPRLGPLAVMAATEPDVALLRAELGFAEDPGRPLHISRLYTASTRIPALALAGPLVGAPHAVMLAENLIAWGSREIVFCGWCGAVSPRAGIGDLLLPTAALIDEGTSRHYAPRRRRSAADPALRGRLAASCRAVGAAALCGAVWTTDAPFCETPSRVAAFRGRGALAVEMECSALFTVCAAREAAAAALLVVSDDLSGLTWRPGFRDPRFSRGRRLAARAVAAFCRLPPGEAGPIPAPGAAGAPGRLRRAEDAATPDPER